MRRKRIPGWRLFMIFGAVSLCALPLAGCEPIPGKLIETREAANDKFKVRVEVYGEGNRAHIFEAGCHVKLASARLGSDDWHQFSNAYFARCGQIPSDRVRFVNDETAYVFMQWWYAVTKDGGLTWSSWDVPRHLAGRAFYNTLLIREVSVGGDGTGTMILNPEGTRDKAPLTLYTRDFGLSWEER